MTDKKTIIIIILAVLLIASLLYPFIKGIGYKEAEKNYAEDGEFPYFTLINNETIIAKGRLEDYGQAWCQNYINQIQGGA